MSHDEQKGDRSAMSDSQRGQAHTRTHTHTGTDISVGDLQLGDLHSCNH